MAGGKSEQFNEIRNQLIELMKPGYNDQVRSLTPLRSGDLLSHLHQVFDTSCYLIDPAASEQASPLANDRQQSQQGLVTYLQMVDALMKRNEPKPIISILANEASPFYTDTHWITSVYLPQRYTLPNGECIVNEKSQWFWIDSLPHCKIPKSLKNGLKIGVNVRAIKDGKDINIHIPGHFSDSKFLSCQNFMLQPEDQSNATGYWALYNAMMLVITGSAEFLYQFNERSPIAACRISTLFPAPSETDTHKATFYSCSDLKTILSTQTILMDPFSNECDLDALSCIHPELDVYVRIIERLDPRTFLNDTLDYLIKKDFQEIKPRRVCYFVMFKDGGARPWIVEYDGLDNHTLELIRECYSQDGNSFDLSVIYQLYTQVNSQLLGQEDKENVRKLLEEYLRAPVHIEPLTVQPGQRALVAPLLVENSFEMMYAGFGRGAQETYAHENSFSELQDHQKLWVQFFLHRFDRYASMNPGLHPQLEIKFKTFWKLLLLTNQINQVFLFQPENSLYSLRALATRYEQVKHTIYGLETYDLNQLLALCPTNVLIRWFRDLARSENLFNTLEAQLAQMRATVVDFESTLAANTCAKSTWSECFKSYLRQTADYVVQGSFMAPVGHLFEGLARTVKPYLADYFASLAFMQTGGSHEAAQRIRHATESLDIEEVAIVGRYAGYLVGGLLVCRLGYYSALKMMMLTSATLKYQSNSNEKIIDEATASITKERSSVVGPMGFYRLLGLGISLGESLYHNNPQYFVICLGATGISFVVGYCYKRYTPLPKTAAELLDYQNGLFLTSLTGQILGQKLLGHIAYNFNRFKLCHRASSLVEPKINALNQQLVLAECEHTPFTMRFWTNEPVRVGAIAKKANDVTTTYEYKIDFYVLNPSSFFSNVGVMIVTDSTKSVQVQEPEPELQQLALP